MFSSRIRKVQKIGMALYQSISRSMHTTLSMGAHKSQAHTNLHGAHALLVIELELCGIGAGHEATCRRLSSILSNPALHNPYTTIRLRCGVQSIARVPRYLH